MDSAIFRLTLKQAETTLATDGKYLYYGIDYILQRYRKEPQQVTRDILHVVLHCIFRHSFVKLSVDIPVWDLAVDIAVENLINQLGIPCSKTSRVTNQQKVLDNLNKNLKSMNAEHIYHYFKNHNITAERAEELRILFLSDDHSSWYNRQKQQRLQGFLQDNDDHGDSDQASQNNSQGQGEDGENEPQSSESFSESDGSSVEADWERVSRQIQMDLESFGKQRGIQAGSMVQQLRELNREKYDYTAFLKKFAVMGEAMKINDDEFDYIFYTYGLKLYGNVPLIEPLEYKEVKRIREFVVAIDTSGSTSGPLVQRFLQKTYNILKSTESFFSKINLHIIQCDAEVQEHVKITSQIEFDEYINTLQVHGLGGTDFRPVFREVDRMIAEQEFSHLKGIIYFTDGIGAFPAQKPSYETAFVFVQDEYNNLKVPPWAIKLILKSEEI